MKKEVFISEENFCICIFISLGCLYSLEKSSVLEIFVKIQINEYIPSFMYIQFSEAIGIVYLPALVKLEVFIIYNKTSFGVKGIKSRFTALFSLSKIAIFNLVFPISLFVNISCINSQDNDDPSYIQHYFLVYSTPMNALIQFLYHLITSHWLSLINNKNTEAQSITNCSNIHSLFWLCILRTLLEILLLFSEQYLHLDISNYHP